MLLMEGTTGMNPAFALERGEGTREGPSHDNMPLEMNKEETTKRTFVFILRRDQFPPGSDWVKLAGESDLQGMYGAGSGAGLKPRCE